MFRVNFVYDDEELLEPYEWQGDDCYKEYVKLPIYRVTLQTLHDFMYGKLLIENFSETLFIVSDTHYHLVIEMKDHCLYKRGTVDFKQRAYLSLVTAQLPISEFHYQILEEAYEKEYGLTRQERMKKMCLEEVIDEIFVVHYELFQQICEELNIHEDGPSEQYLALKQKIEKGYSSLHELLYKELVQKK